MSLDPATRDILIVVTAVLALLALALVAAALGRLRRLRHDYDLLQDGDGGESFVALVARKTEQVEALQAQVAAMTEAIERTRVELADAIRHVSVVRYDAFGDMGGRLSFSAALLDDGGDGLVMTSIHGRAETRMYVKGIRAGQSDAELSSEEREAVTYAIEGAPK